MGIVRYYKLPMNVVRELYYRDIEETGVMRLQPLRSESHQSLDNELGRRPPPVRGEPALQADEDRLNPYTREGFQSIRFMTERPSLPLLQRTSHISHILATLKAVQLELLALTFMLRQQLPKASTTNRRQLSLKRISAVIQDNNPSQNSFQGHSFAAMPLLLAYISIIVSHLYLQ